MPLTRIAIVALITILIDQITKFLVVEWLDLANRLRITVWDPYFNLTMAWNEGINFGWFGSEHDAMRYVLITVAIAIVAVLIWWARNKPSWLIPVCVGLITGGALGNVVDRIYYGAVADFINVSCCNITNPFAFNVADIAIFIGAVWLILFADRAANEQ